MKNTIAILSLMVVVLGMMILNAYAETEVIPEDQHIIEYTNEEAAPEQIANDCADVAPYTVSIDGYALSDAEYELACKIVQAEAGGEPYIGKLAVAQTIKDRMITRNQSAWQVMTAKYQYCATATKISAETEKAVTECFKDNRNAVDGICITHFYSGENAPYWATDDCYVCTIGGHKFYSRG